jgi:hypothetical protein
MWQTLYRESDKVISDLVIFEWSVEVCDGMMLLKVATEMMLLLRRRRRRRRRRRGDRRQTPKTRWNAEPSHSFKIDTVRGWKIRIAG